MKARHLFLVTCASVTFASGAALAGPCNTAKQDAGSGPTPGMTTQSATTTGAVGRTEEHPPTGTMNKAAGNVATSSEDAQRQMQAQPTASQEAQGAKPKTGNDC